MLIQNSILVETPLIYETRSMIYEINTQNISQLKTDDINKKKLSMEKKLLFSTRIYKLMDWLLTPYPLHYYIH